MSIFKGLAAAAVLGFAVSLLPLPTLATVSMGSDPTVQEPHHGMFLAEATKKKAAKAKTKAKAKTPAAKSKTQDRGTVSTPLTPGEYR